MKLPLTDQQLYTERFYARQYPGSFRSAVVVRDILFEHFVPTSVIDLGCGIGTWLKAFSESGVRRIHGRDGVWVRDRLLISPDNFLPSDLSEVVVGDMERFDLAMSLEVLEHLPPSASGNFVASLCNLADVILFSAAIPGQGGTHHINERWQSFWAEIFLSHGYYPFDCIRPYIMGDQTVEWWYQQNIVLYIKENHGLSNRLAAYRRSPTQLDWVHPILFEDCYRRANFPKLREMIRKIPGALSRDIKRAALKISNGLML